MIASYQTLKKLQPIKDMVERTKAFGLTYGLSPAGYDIRCAEELYMWPSRFTLASSIEMFQMPNNLLGIVHDKSTWARMGLAVQNTVIEPNWRGFLTIELSNHGDRGFIIKKGSPICQIVFHFLDEPTELIYTGKYQDQKAGPQPAIFEGE